MDSTLIDVIIENLENNPHCFHGPTLLFRRLKGKRKHFYACSACRDRKECNFFVPACDLDKKSTVRLSSHWKKQQNLVLSFMKNQNLQSNGIATFKNSLDGKLEKKMKNKLKTPVKCNYCYTCSCFFNESDNNHKQCRVILNLTQYQLTHPTEILLPKVDSKTHAQYFFSKTTVNDIVLMLTRLKISKLLCIGAPRIHEFVVNNCKDKIKSILLDIDKNYFNFYSRNEFIWFNMFNNYIFDPEQKPILNEYLSSGKILLLLDPPFGGRVEPLAHTINEISKSCFNSIDQKKGDSMIHTFWFFPYFMERHISRSLSEFKMFDYKVNYDNHSSFTDFGNKRRKFGSPVRIFTNVPLPRLDLNGVSGYKFCKFCDYWVSNENRHCKECEACTSKDGRTYVHCSKCSKCFKPTYKHCEKCERCCLPSHVCGEFRPDPNCYHCHLPGHKKDSCPHLKKRKKKKIEETY